MDAYSHLFYGLGQVAYAVAMADGGIQREEEQKLQEIIKEHLAKHEIEFDYSDIIFKILKSDDILDSESAYKDGIYSIKLGGNHLTDELRKTFVSIIDVIAASFPPKTAEETELLERFKLDLRAIN